MDHDDKRQLNRLEDKVDDVNKHLGSIDSTLMAQHVSLTEHMRRTALLEADLKPIKRHVDMVAGALKLITLLGILAGVYEAVRMIK